MYKRIKTVFSVAALIALVFNLAPSNASALTPVEIRWFVGVGTGAQPEQVPIEQAVVDDFNAAHTDIHLTLEVVTSDLAPTVLANEIANDNAPDIVGPVGWFGSNLFHDQWEDLDPLITAASYDTSQFPQELMDLYHTDIGQEGLPFATYPSGIYFNTSLFVAAGLYYPPSRYGDQYEMPDGSMVDWNWDTIAEVGKLLTLDANGKNAKDPDFDKNNIVQYGWSWQWEDKPSYVGTYWKSGTNETFLVPGGSAGSYQARIPDAWKASWQWMYDGIWGSQPFIPTSDVEGSDAFNGGNTFDSGKLAMAEMPVWYACCLGDVGTWDVAAMPSYNGQVAGRIDADSFRILKGSHHKTEAFTVLSYLIGEGVQKLIIGSDSNPPAYGALPARAVDQLPWRVARHQQFPWVQNWKTFIAGLAYSDTPSAEAWMPNMNRSWNRSQEFLYLLRSTPGLNVDTESETFRADLETIFNGAPPTDIAISNDNLDEGQPAGTLVGTLSTTDADSSTFGYDFCGGPDDGSFQINGDSLQTARILDFETASSYSICIRSTDDFGLDTTKLFSININDIVETTVTFKSTGTQDGWVLESTETSNKGGTLNTAATLLYVGDDAQDKQYKSFLSFNTISMPENAHITKVQLSINIQGFVGGNMFTPNKTLGDLLVDIKKPYYGSNASLVVGDFQATPQNGVGTLDSVSSAGWYTIPLTDTSPSSVNPAGTTQLRLRFTKDDNNDMSADYLKIFSGDAPAANRPQLIIEYYIP